MSIKSNTNMIRNNPMIDNEECYVAFLDILGFSAMVKDNSPESITEMLCDLVNRENMVKGVVATSYGNTKNTVDTQNQLHDELFIYNISDSIVLAINASIKNSLDFLIKICEYIQWYLFEKHDVLIRGGVAKGCIYAEGVIAFGKGWVRAYELEETEAIFPRIVLDKNLESEIKEWNIDIFDDETEKLEPGEYKSLKYFYSVIKESFDDYCYINWFKYTNLTKLNELCKREIKKGGRIKAKYEWIAERINVKRK